MFESKYSKVLTVILIIVIVAIIGLLGFLAYDYYQKYVITADTSDFVDSFEGDVQDEQNENTTGNENTGEGDPLDQIESAQGSGNGSTKVTYKGFGVLGTMEIPATNFKYPILEKVTKKSIETAVAFLYGSGINQPGNSVIIGHKIYITDNAGNQLTYTIYNKFETTPEDTSFYQRDTGGKAEITLSTCTDDSKARLIIFAKAE